MKANARIMLLRLRKRDRGSLRKKNTKQEVRRHCLQLESASWRYLQAKLRKDDAENDHVESKVDNVFESAIDF